jgi:hypothetical protein
MTVLAPKPSYTNCARTPGGLWRTASTGYLPFTVLLSPVLGHQAVVPYQKERGRKHILISLSRLDTAPESMLVLPNNGTNSKTGLELRLEPGL